MTTLLVIEDEPDMRESLITTLGFEGFRVFGAADGPAGLALARRHHPDLIVCDIQLPGRDGYAVLAEVRADPDLGAIPFIFLTARGEKGDQRQGMVQGADDYLVKPVAIADLLAAIRARLARFARPPRRADFTEAPSGGVGALAQAGRDPAVGGAGQEQRRGRRHPRRDRGHGEEAPGAHLRQAGRREARRGQPAGHRAAQPLSVSPFVERRIPPAP